MKDLSKKWLSMSFRSPNTSLKRLTLCFFVWRMNMDMVIGNRSNMLSNETPAVDSTTFSCRVQCKSSKNESIYLSNRLRKRSMISSMDWQDSPAIGAEITRRRGSQRWRRTLPVMLMKRMLWAIEQKLDTSKSWETMAIIRWMVVTVKPLAIIMTLI